MKRTTRAPAVVFALLLGSATCASAQEPSVDQFFQYIATHPVDDATIRDQSGAIYMALANGPPAETANSLAALLPHTGPDIEAHARTYAIFFLTAVAIRADRTKLLSSYSDQLSTLLLDADPSVQKAAVVITDYALVGPDAPRQPYLSALEAAIQNQNLRQDVGADMLLPFLQTAASDPSKLRDALGFLHREDLNATTKQTLLRTLSTIPCLPVEITQYLINQLNDPEPQLRVAALVAFAHSTTSYHSLAKDHVEQMASDRQEDPRIRELARQALSGKTDLNPNALIPNMEPPPGTSQRP